MLIVLGLVIAIVAAFLVLSPVLRPARAATVAEPAFDEPEDDPLEHRKELALAALKEIEFDRATGKLSDGDYQLMLTRYTREAVEALRAVDAVDAAPDAEPAAAPAAEAAPALAAAGGGNGHAPSAGDPAAADDAIERIIAEARQAGRTAGRRYCSECGALLEGSGRFCVECGART